MLDRGSQTKRPMHPLSYNYWLMNITYTTGSFVGVNVAICLRLFGTFFGSQCTVHDLLNNHQNSLIELFPNCPQ
jgi:hypothetical protein